MTGTALMLLMLLLMASSIQPHELLPLPVAEALCFLWFLSLCFTSLPILYLPAVRLLLQLLF